MFELSLEYFENLKVLSDTPGYSKFKRMTLEFSNIGLGLESPRDTLALSD